MDMRDLGRTGLTITPIGLGCWQLQQGKGMTGMMWSALEPGDNGRDSLGRAARRDLLVRHRAGLRQRTLGMRPRGRSAPRRRRARQRRHRHQVAADPQAGARHPSQHRRAHPVHVAVSHRPLPGPHPLEPLVCRGADAGDGRAGPRRQGARRRREQLLGQADGPGRRGPAGGGAAARLQPGAHQPARPLHRDQRRPRPGARAPRDPDRLLTAGAGHPHRPVPRRSLAGTRRCPGGAAPG